MSDADRVPSAFIEMHPGDLVVTPGNGKLHVARFEGRPYYIDSDASLSS